MCAAAWRLGSDKMKAVLKAVEERSIQQRGKAASVVGGEMRDLSPMYSKSHAVRHIGQTSPTPRERILGTAAVEDAFVGIL